MKKNETRMLLAGADVSARSSPRVEVAEERRRRALTSRDALLVEEQILEYELLVKGLQRSNPVERARADALRSASIANAQCAAVGREVIEDLRGAIERAGRGRIAAELLPGGMRRKLCVSFAKRGPRCRRKCSKSQNASKACATGTLPPA